MHIIERLTKEINTVKTETKTPIITPQPEDSIKWWQQPLRFGIWVIVIMVLIYAAEKLYKNVKQP
jgi:hypothetical protein